MYINSHFDASGCITNYRPFDYVSVSVGRFKKIKAFQGAIAELFVFFYPLSNGEIENHYQDGLNELECGDGQFLQKIIEKDEADFNRQTFATEKHVPDAVLRQVDVSPQFFKTIREEVTNEELNDRQTGHLEDQIEAEHKARDEAEVMQNLNLFIMENPMIADQISNIAKNYEWLLTVASVMATGGVNKDGTIEITRFSKLLKFTKIKLPRSAIIEMAELTKTMTEILDEHDDKIKYKGILYYYFLKTIQKVVYADMMSNLDDEDIEKVSIGTFKDSDDLFEEPEPEESEEEKEVAAGANLHKDSFHSSPDKFARAPSPQEYDVNGDPVEKSPRNSDEHEKSLDPIMPEKEEGRRDSVVPKTELDNMSVNEEGLMKHQEQDQLFNEPKPEAEPELEEEPEEELQDDLSLPDLDEQWNSGAFEVNIIRCSKCHLHFDYCRHSEDHFVNMFNDVGNEISEKFPDVVVIGNHERPSYLGCFDVYVRGVGPMNKRDSQGRYFLYKQQNNLNVKKVPNTRDILDTLIILSMLYGTSKKLGDAQKDFKRNYSYLIPKPEPEMHEHPMDMPETVRKQSLIVKRAKALTDRVMVCKNWACGREYPEDRNEKNSCKYHPGVYQFGSRHGLWPESWTCCRSEWESAGCRLGKHKGEPKESFTRLCNNHGEPNPDSIYPDSFCGKPFRLGVKKQDWQMTAEDKEALLQCRVHSGYLKVDKRAGTAEWTCCNEDASAPPCSEGEHKFSDFPEEEAKKYFYDKPLKPIGDFGSQNMYASEYEQYGRFCGIFREAKQYVDKNPPEKPHISRDEQKKLDVLDKV